jgi:hypothetical protein
VAEGVGRETDVEMPQVQLAIFPADVTPINQQVAVRCESGKVVYVHGLMPVFQHERGDLASFRLFTSQNDGQTGRRQFLSIMRPLGMIRLSDAPRPATEAMFAVVKAELHGNP